MKLKQFPITFPRCLWASVCWGFAQSLFAFEAPRLPLPMYCGCQAGLPRHERHSALFSSLVSSSSAPETPACRNLVIQQNKQKKPIKHTLIPDLGCLALPSRDVSCCTLKNAVSLHPKESCAAFWKTYLFRRNKLHRLHSALERNYLHRQLRKSNHCYNKLH